MLGIAITHDLRHRDENDIDASAQVVVSGYVLPGLQVKYGVGISDVRVPMHQQSPQFSEDVILPKKPRICISQRSEK